MSRIIRIQLTALLLINTLWGCTDHSSRPLTPLRLRLKTTTSANFDGTTTQNSFTYDAQNRLIAYSEGNDTRGTITYNAQNQYQRIDFVRGSATYRTDFTYQTFAGGSRSVTAVTNQVFQNGVTGLADTRTYSFDANNRLTRSSYAPAGSTPIGETISIYTYTGENITQVQANAIRTVATYLYEFDDKPNPFYGLVGAGIDEVRRYSRNNLVKYTPVPSASYIYSYEYNAQGLPTKIDNVTLTYESY